MALMLSLRESFLDRNLQRLKQWVFRLLTKNSSMLFLKGGDNISVAPWIFGLHEPRIKNLIDSFATDGYGGFLIDIGANIGLISCQSGNLFKQVHMFEPNPDCCSILGVNVRIALDKCEAVLHPVGLGSAKGTATLNVPKHNWGGAFVHSNDNSYADTQLASKDGFSQFDIGNYLSVEIRIEPARDELEHLFRKLDNDGCRAGVVKIDAEGYEILILEAIAETLPPNFKVIVVFEYWDKDFDPSPLLGKFGNRVTAHKLVRTPPKSTAKLKRFWRILVDGYRYVLKPFADNDSSTDIVFVVGERLASN